MSRVAVLKGGRSLERQVSLRSGARVEDALERLGHEVVPIDAGLDLIRRLEESRPDAVFLVLHGRGGEDGTVQELLEILGLPYRVRVLACTRAIDKVLTKHLLAAAGMYAQFFAFNETAFKELGAADALPAIEEAAPLPDRGQAGLRRIALGIKFARTPEDVPQALVAVLVRRASPARAVRERPGPRRGDSRRSRRPGGAPGRRGDPA